MKKSLHLSLSSIVLIAGSLLLLTTAVSLVVKTNTAYSATCGIQSEPQIKSFYSSLSSDQKTVKFWYSVSVAPAAICDLPVYIYLNNFISGSNAFGDRLGVETIPGGGGSASGWTDLYDVSGISFGEHGVMLTACAWTGLDCGPSDVANTSFTISRPNCSVSFSPSSYVYGEGQTTATWHSANASSVSYSCDYTGGGPLSLDGSYTYGSTEIPVGNHSCTLTASSDHGSTTCSAGVNVNEPASESPQPTANLSGPATVCSGEKPVMSWSSTNAKNCSVTAGAGFHAWGLTEGTCGVTDGTTCPNSWTSPPSAASQTFSIQCYENVDRSGKSSNIAAATVTAVNCAPAGSFSCTLSANPASGAPPLSSTLTASASNGSGGYTYNYSYGDGSSSGYIASNASSHTYNSTATFTPSVTVKDSSGKTTSCNTTVTVGSSGPVTTTHSLSVDPFEQSVAVGGNKNFYAIYTTTYSDGGDDQADVTASAVWSSTNELIATSLGGGVFKGVTQGGPIVVQATYGGKTASGRLTVTQVAQGTLKLDAAIVDSSCNLVSGGSLAANGILNTDVAITTNSTAYNPGSFSVPSGDYIVSLATISKAGYQPANCPSGNATNFSPHSVSISSGESKTITSYFKVGSNLEDVVPVEFEMCAQSDPRPECQVPPCTEGDSRPVCGGSGGLSCVLDATPKDPVVNQPVTAAISNVLGGSGNYLYSFDFGDDYLVDYQSAALSSHSYNKVGSYTIKGNAKDKDDPSKIASCKDIAGNDNIPVTVSPPPSGCDFYASPQSVLTGGSSSLIWSCLPGDTDRNCTVTNITNPKPTVVITGKKNQSGSVPVKNLTSDQRYNLSCVGGAPAVEDSQTMIKVGFAPVIKEIIPR
jgi:hypothetical protein